MWGALGSCEEYSATSTVIFPDPFHTYDYPFIDCPRAGFCTEPGERWTYDILASLGVVLVMIAFLIRLSYLQRQQSMEHDQLDWSPNDFTVQLAGLPVWVECKSAATMAQARHGAPSPRG